MVSVGVSKLGITNLNCVDPGAKVNGTYYRDVLLSQQLLPMMRNVSGEFFIFQQDNAPAHRACDTVTLCDLSSKQHLLSFHRIYATKRLLWHYQYAYLYNYVTWNVLCCVKYDMISKAYLHN